MPHTARIGIQIGPDDPFWVQVREVMWHRAQLLAVKLVEITIQGSYLLSPDEQVEVVEDLLVQDIDALITNTYPTQLLTAILDQGIPIIYVSEIELRHPLFSSRRGLYDAGTMIGAYLGGRLAPGGAILVVGGLGEGEDSGRSRLDGFFAAVGQGDGFALHHIPCRWTYAEAHPQVAAYLEARPGLSIDAIYGLSDTLALAARDVCQALGRSHAGTLVLGINGDPLALAAIADGSMSATVETDVDDIAAQAVELASRAARGEQLPPFQRNIQRLVTAENVAEVATRKLMSLATLPTRLVGINRRNEQQRVIQLETSLAIDRKVSQILDERELALAITTLIRDSYGFEHARFLVYDESARRLAEVTGAAHAAGAEIAVEPLGPLAYALAHNQPVFIPDAYASHRFAPDPLLPDVRARVVVPVHLSGRMVGLLDLQRHQPAHQMREEIDGLQLLADQLGITMRNAELYSQALAARAQAEKADRLKTALLANVSHELRTPLNVILGHSRALLDAAGDAAEPEGLAVSVGHIRDGGEHLLRLINDLLDLSRAEIGELDLLPERIDTRSFLEDVFRSSANSFGAGGLVEWRLELPDTLPPVVADPVRLRQVLLNLLHNAHKFTLAGRISLGAAANDELHLWVADTGPGIASDLHEQIFEPFVTLDAGRRRREGIGLGLSITRRLVALHHGRMTLDSQRGAGSTFHLYLPLPAEPAQPPAGGRRSLLLISRAPALPESLVQLATRRGLPLTAMRPGDTLATTLADVQPALVAWDISTTADDGWSVVEQIRARPPFAQVPLVLCSSEDDSTLAAVGATTGLLLKPLEDHALFAALDDLGPRHASGSVLIVEDDERTRALHRRAVARHLPSYTILESGDGRAALEVVSRETPSLILLDLTLPEIDGFAVLAALRADLRTSGVPVLVLSGRTLSAEDIKRLGEARVIFQTKDILSEDELARSLRQTLEQADRLPQQTSALVKAAIAFIQQHYDEPFARQAIADRVGVNKDYLGRIFQQELGLSPWEYLIRLRVLRAKELLVTTSYTIAEIASRVGFDTATYFSHIFHREVGCSPRQFRAGPRPQDP